jgi:hypothetical protein
MSTNLLEDFFAERPEQRFEQGRVEGERAMLRRYLTWRFGSIPPALEERISRADAETLTTLFDQALAATTLDDL